MTRFLVFLLRLYQLTLSRVFVALFGPVCRFTPSCSAYAIACVKSHGALRGTLLSVRRVCRCHPFHPGGYDPPPPPPQSARVPATVDASASPSGPESLPGAPSPATPGPNGEQSEGAPRPTTPIRASAHAT